MNVRRPLRGPTLLLGGGGFCRESLDAMRATGNERTHIVVIDPFLTRDARKALARWGIEVDGAVDRFSPDECPFLVTIGSPRVRRTLTRQMEGSGYRPTHLIHPSAQCADSLGNSSGLVVCAGAVVSPSSSLGRHVHVNARAVVEGGVSIGDHTSVNPGSHIGCGARLGSGVLIGARASIAPYVVVGTNALVAAGAVVLRDVPEMHLALGNPARFVPRGTAP